MSLPPVVYEALIIILGLRDVLARQEKLSCFAVSKSTGIVKHITLCGCGR